MIILFQILIIGLVMLIAYWWANQGFLSALLHFVAVVCAGAIAFAVWEPLVVGVFLNNTFFDHYAWGVTLVGVFGISLLIMRIAFDKLVPGNVHLPRSADLLFGGVLGAGSGILTVGLLVIGFGFVQSADRIMGFKGLGRANNEITTVHDGDTHVLWLPAHTLTVKFYELLSSGSLRPDFGGIALRQANPRLDQQALALIRDTYEHGTSRITLPPDSVKITSATYNDHRVYVGFTVDIDAFDHAQQFVMSNSQIRLLGYANADIRHGWVSVAFPDQWTQKVSSTRFGTGGELKDEHLEFDDVGHYITSVPGQQNATFQVEFKKGLGDFELNPGVVPVYIQLKGVRYKLPNLEEIAGEGSGLAVGGNRTSVPNDPSAPLDSTGAISVRGDVRPLNVSVNYLTGKVKHEERLLTEGSGVFAKGKSKPNRQNRVLGFFTPDFTKIVQVDVSRGGQADIYGPARDRAGDSAAPVLVDALGNIYRPIGYIIDRPDKVEIKLDPSHPIGALSELPHLPTSGQMKMRLIYQVTSSMIITSFRLDDETVLQTSLQIQ